MINSSWVFWVSEGLMLKDVKSRINTIDDASQCIYSQLSLSLPLSLSLSHTHTHTHTHYTHTHTHTHIYIYIYIYMCVCVCVCFSSLHVSFIIIHALLISIWAPFWFPKNVFNNDLFVWQLKARDNYHLFIWALLFVWFFFFFFTSLINSNIHLISMEEIQ